MTIYTLYVKTHRKTGLKYLGQTSQDPFNYPGSGTDWKSHLEEFGNDVHTEILLQTHDKSERNQSGRFYSALWHVVTASDDYGNKIWANRIPETGGGSCHPEITKRAMNRPEVKEKRKETDAKPEVKARRSAALTEVGSRPETKKKRSAAAKKNYEDDSKREMVTKRTNKMKETMSLEETRKRISESVTETHWTKNTDAEEVMRRISEAKTGVKLKRVVCEHCGKDVAANIYTRYHGDKCKHLLNK